MDFDNVLKAAIFFGIIILLFVIACFNVYGQKTKDLNKVDTDDTTDDARAVTIDAQDEGPRLCTSCNDHFHEILAELVDERVANQQVNLRIGPYGQHAHFINNNNIVEPPPQYDERPPTYEECVRS